MHVVVSGSSGLIGTALQRRLTSDGHRVTRLVRSRPASGPGAPGTVAWDPARGVLDPASLVGVDAAVNLAGAGIGDHRWTDEYKRTVMDSRVRSTELLSGVLARLEPRPTVLLSGSAIGFYGDRGDEVLDESSGPGSGFLSEVCLAWEAATLPAAEAGIRVAHLRTGIVLAAEGGALRKQLPLFKLGLGGRFGRGRQWQSWVALEDEVAAIVHLLTADVAGPVDITAPQPVTNAEFGKTLGHVLGRPAVLPVPAFGPGLLLGRELTNALLFESQRVVPKVLTASGYEFRHPQLAPALRSILGRS